MDDGQEKLDAEKRRQIEAEIKGAINDSFRPLAMATTVFPFTLIPDTVSIDREKLTVAHRVFVRVAEVLSIRISDILNITADVGPFFGSLKIASHVSSQPLTVSYLWRNDALRFKRIAQGYLIALQKKIDLSPFSNPELAEMLDRLGQAQSVDT